MSTLAICCANLVIVVGLAACIVSLAMEYWVKITVNRANLPASMQQENNEVYYSRQRGIFRTCFEDDAAWLNNYKPIGKTIKGNCLMEDIFKLENNSEIVSLGDKYGQRNDLIAVHLAFQCLAILFLLVSFIVGICGCHRYSASTVRITGILALLASLFMAGAMTVFHFYEYLEKKLINHGMFYKVWSTLPAMNGNFSYKYHFAYMLGWIGMALAFITACWYFYLAKAVIREKRRMKDRQERYAEERTRNYDHLVENPAKEYSRWNQRDPYRY